MSRDVEGDCFERGLVLFNAGRFFECHEVWEELWKRSSGDERLFYQGLIQAAVAILHVERGNMRGAASIWAKARQKLEPLPSEHMGLALGEFRTSLQKFFASVSKGGFETVRPKLRLLASPARDSEVR
jgi:predicted metal-dependent hydrolase